MSSSWDDYFMTMVYFVASRSKDQRTHIGAVVVDKNKKIRSTGYNGFARGLNDNVPERQEKGEKQYWFEHAERNAIYNAQLSLIDCIMYTQGVPCADCARAIIQEGIVEVVVDKKWDPEGFYTRRNFRTITMFEETGVKLRYYEPEYVKVKKMDDGIVSDLD